MVEKKPWYASKILWVNILTIVATVLSMVMDMKFATPQTGQVVLIALAVVNMLLRMISHQPITEDAERQARKKARSVKVGLSLMLSTLLLTSCTMASFQQNAATVYRSPERARTVLTAMQTLRYAAAQDVAKACVQGRLEPSTCNTYEKADDAFRASWEKASDLVRLWLTMPRAVPRGLQESMSQVEDQAAKVEAIGRGAQ